MEPLLLPSTDDESLFEKYELFVATCTYDGVSLRATQREATGASRVLSLERPPTGSVRPIAFVEDDLIQITSAPAHAQWWHGTLNGVSAVFPAPLLESLDASMPTLDSLEDTIATMNSLLARSSSTPRDGAAGEEDVAEADLESFVQHLEAVSYLTPRGDEEETKRSLEAILAFSGERTARKEESDIEETEEEETEEESEEEDEEEEEEEERAEESSCEEEDEEEDEEDEEEEERETGMLNEPCAAQPPSPSPLSPSSPASSPLRTKEAEAEQEAGAAAVSRAATTAPRSAPPAVSPPVLRATSGPTRTKRVLRPSSLRISVTDGSTVTKKVAEGGQPLASPPATQKSPRMATPAAFSGASGGRVIKKIRISRPAPKPSASLSASDAPARQAAKMVTPKLVSRAKRSPSIVDVVCVDDSDSAAADAAANAAASPSRSLSLSRRQPDGLMDIGLPPPSDDEEVDEEEIALAALIASCDEGDIGAAATAGSLSPAPERGDGAERSEKGNDGKDTAMEVYPGQEEEEKGEEEEKEEEEEQVDPPERTMVAGKQLQEVQEAQDVQEAQEEAATPHAAAAAPPVPSVSNADVTLNLTGIQDADAPVKCITPNTRDRLSLLTPPDEAAPVLPPNLGDDLLPMPSPRAAPSPSSAIPAPSSTPPAFSPAVDTGGVQLRAKVRKTLRQKQQRRNRQAKRRASGEVRTAASPSPSEAQQAPPVAKAAPQPPVRAATAPTITVAAEETPTAEVQLRPRVRKALKKKKGNRGPPRQRPASPAAAAGGEAGGEAPVTAAAAHDKRRMHFFEIVATERSYVQAMERLVEVMAGLLQIQAKLTAAGDTGEKLPQELQTLHVSATIILGYSKKILEMMIPRLHAYSADTCIGDIFLLVADFLKIYTQYVRGYEPFVTKFLQVRQKNKVLREAVEKYEVSVGSFIAFESHLIVPVQRIPRYALLLSDILRNTEESHRDHALLQEAVRKIEKVAEFVNARQRVYENLNKVIELEKRFGKQLTEDTGISQFVRSHRRLVMEGRMLMLSADAKDKGKKVKVYLLNDLMVVGSMPRQSGILTANSKLLSVVCLWLIVMRDVEDTPGREHCLELLLEATDESIMVLKASSEEEKQQWMREIRKIKRALKKAINVGAKTIEQRKRISIALNVKWTSPAIPMEIAQALAEEQAQRREQANMQMKSITRMASSWTKITELPQEITLALRESEKQGKAAVSPVPSRAVSPIEEALSLPLSPPESPERDSPSGERRRKGKGFKKTFSPLMRHRTEGSLSEQKATGLAGSWSPKLLKLSRLAKPKDKGKNAVAPSNLKLAISPRSEKPISPRSRSKSPRLALPKVRSRRKRSSSVSDSPGAPTAAAEPSPAILQARRVLSLNDLGPDAMKATKLVEAEKRQKAKGRAVSRSGGATASSSGSKRSGSSRQCSRSASSGASREKTALASASRSGSAGRITTATSSSSSSSISRSGERSSSRTEKSTRSSRPGGSGRSSSAASVSRSSSAAVGGKATVASSRPRPSDKHSRPVSSRSKSSSSAGKSRSLRESSYRSRRNSSGRSSGHTGTSRLRAAESPAERPRRKPKGTGRDYGTMRTTRCDVGSSSSPSKERREERRGDRKERREEKREKREQREDSKRKKSLDP